MSGITDYPYREIVKLFEPGLVFSEMIASRALLEKNKKTMKMIKKTDNFLSAIQIAGCDPEVMKEAAKICEDNGADFVKTSTGFSKFGASAKIIKIIKSVLNSGTKIKASGGIKSLNQLDQLIKLGVDRFGTSSSVIIMNEINDK